MHVTTNEKPTYREKIAVYVCFTINTSANTVQNIPAIAMSTAMKKMRIYASERKNEAN